MNLGYLDTDDSGGTDSALTGLSAAIDDVAFLTRARHRVVALDALADRPLNRSELRALTGVSSSTIGRTLGELERRNWIRKEGHRYETTQLGAFVASGMRKVLDRFETEGQLRGVWQWLPTESSGFSLTMVSDADVTIATAERPYCPVNRFVSLLRETDRFRFVGLDLGLLEPCRDEFRDRVLDGMRTEIIDPQRVADYLRSTYPDHCSGPIESGNLTVLVHDDVPAYGISLFDDRVALSGCDPESGAVQALVDTDSPAARAWAESRYEAYRSEAHPLSREMVS